MRNWSRKKKILFWLAILLICATFLYAISGHSPSPEMAMRRLEKQNLIGPSQIIGREVIEPSDYSNSTEMIIGTSEYGYTVFSWSGNNWDNTGYLKYSPKENGVTLVLPLRRHFTTIYGGYLCPIILFTENGDGSSARLSLNFDLHDDKFTCITEAQRTNEGYFLFLLSSEQQPMASINALMTVLGFTDGVMDATLELYDYDGTLISTQQFQWTESR